MIVRGLVFLSILVMVFLISRQNASQREKIKQMELDAEAAATAAAQAQPRMSDPIPIDDPMPGESTVEPEFIVTRTEPSTPEEGETGLGVDDRNLLQRERAAEEPASTPKEILWGFVDGIDLKGGGFHLHKNSDPALKGDKEENTKTCVEKCSHLRNCKAVVFNRDRTKCWAKDTLEVDNKAPGWRHYFQKCETDGSGCNDPKPIDQHFWVDCEGNWSEWSSCGLDGKQYRSFNVRTQSKGGGESCPSPLKEERQCEVLWGFVDGTDLKGGGFLLGRWALKGDKEENTKTCVEKCIQEPNCKAVVFNEDRTACWGKDTLEVSNITPNRHYFQKCERLGGSDDCEGFSPKPTEAAELFPDPAAAPAPAPAAAPQPENAGGFTTVQLCSPWKARECERAGPVLTCDEFRACRLKYNQWPCAGEEWFEKCK